MNGRTRPGRSRFRLEPRRAISVSLAAAAALLCSAAVAFAAFHYTNEVYHGIGSTTGGGVGAGKPYAQAQSTYADHLEAAMYHLDNQGNLHRQCTSTVVYWNAYCEGDAWGTMPCRKRAYTRAFRSSGLYTMVPHWMRGATCPGSTHQ